MWHLTLVLFVTYVTFGECSDNPVVVTPLGVLEGRINRTIYDVPFYAFESVPYAEPPVGELRFEEPQPVKPWNGTRKTQRLTNCLQYDNTNKSGLRSYFVDGEEDCLFVNIYTHSLNQSANLDVIIHIHGGAFMFGAGKQFGPNIIMNQQVVYINMNYRLGPLGFLSTEDDVLPGNNGLKDQNLALRYVKENVKYFGGNPDSITIYGLSAGGASVHFHFMMPRSYGLFKQGISQSGVALNPWAITEKPLERAHKLAGIVGCPTASSEELKDCLKYLPGDKIVYAVRQFQPWLYNPFSPFAVVVDSSWATDPVLPDHPINLIRQGRVQDLPWIVSHVSSEGLYPASEFYLQEFLTDIDTRWNEILPFILHYNDTISANDMDQVSQKIREYYMGDLAVNKETFSKFVEIISDRLYNVDIDKSVKLQNAVTKSKIYSYLFDYRGNQSFSDKNNENIGVGHGDDTAYITSTHAKTWTTKNDRQMIEVFVEMFLSFMATGKPVAPIDWPPHKKPTLDADTANFAQLHIYGPSNFTFEIQPEIGHRQFWDSIPFRENEWFETS